MTLIEIDEEKCLKDGLCKLVCPLALIQLPGGGYPKTFPGAEKICIDCGHCVAVCPHGALAQRSMSPEECPELLEELRIGPEEADQFLRSRRSIRRYKKKIVEREELRRIIETARCAPSGHNSQPVRWIVITDPDEVRHLAGLVVDWMGVMLAEKPEFARMMHMDMVRMAWKAGVDTILCGAPHLIVTHAPKKDRMAPTSCTIAMTYLELAAYSRGLGACWAGFFSLAVQSYEPLKEALPLPEGHVAPWAMMVGYPKAAYRRLPARKAPPITWK